MKSKKINTIKKLRKTPTVFKGNKTAEYDTFPVKHYSASSLIKFATNPLLFKIQYINQDRFDTASSIASVIGHAFHVAMQVYTGGSDTLLPTSESEAIEYGLKAGMEFIDKYDDGFINFSLTVPNKQKAFDLFSFGFNSYISENAYGSEKIISTEEKISELIDVEWRGKRLTLPVKLKGYLDKTIEEDGKIKIIDYKTCMSFSNPEKIDGKKIIQAIQYYLLKYAQTGMEPYSITFEEVKLTKNKDGSPQIRKYEIVFAENDLYFDFYFRLYEDITRALNGEMVYVPNLDTFYDNEIGIISYIHRLDVEKEAALLMKKHKVSNITDLLKKEIQHAGNMRKLMKSIEKDFVSAKSIDYTTMKNEEKIQTKLLEHGMLLQFDSVIHGASVDLYRYIPSIGLKMSRVKSYTDDVQQVLGVDRVRILAPIPGTSFIGFEVPRTDRTFPSIPTENGFDLAIGQTIMGEDRRFDVRSAPHMLVAGSSGSGKSVFLSSLIKQFSRLQNTDMHLFDPKMVEFSRHIADRNVVEYQSDVYAISESLKVLVNDMNARYEVLSDLKVRSIEETNGMRYKFVIVDEFGDIIAGRYVKTEYVKTGRVFQRGERSGKEEEKKVEADISKEIEQSILLLAQKGRAAGIHVIISTQRPSTDVIKGTIKANFPVKAVFRTAKAVDSTVVLDETGAEKLLGRGDMLFMADNGIERLQGYSVV